MKPLPSTARALLVAGAVIATLAGSAAGQESSAAAPASGSLAAEIQAAMDAPGWDRGQWGVLVVSLATGDTLFAHRAAEPMVPASNMKLFTTAAALQFLQPDFRYSTYITAMGPVRSGVLEGDLYVYGTGDPTIADRFFESKTAVWEAVADSLAEQGVRRITGDVVGDASYFQGPGVGSGWLPSYITHTYAASASALSFNENIVTLRIRPAETEGAPPRIEVIPAGDAQVGNEATTVAAGRSWIEVERPSYDAPAVVGGRIRQGASAVWRAVPVADPARFAASALADILAERGIQVEGRIRSEYDGAASPITGQRSFAPAFDEDGVIQVLAVHRSPPLQEILEVVNQRSHNLYAESVLRTVGRVATGRGSVEGGEAAVLALLESDDGSAPLLRMDDGSGLSPLDRASATTIVALLSRMAESPYRDAYLATLPEAATSRGLRRMQQTAAAGNLRAKTGTIDEVSALSGYVRAQNGELLAFSIMANGVPSTWGAKRVEDRIGARLAAVQRPTPQQAVAVADEEAADERSTLSTADRPSTESPESESTVYVIKRGDTLEGIARANDTSVAALREANPDLNPRRLIPGQSLQLPGAPGR